MARVILAHAKRIGVDSFGETSGHVVVDVGAGSSQLSSAWSRLAAENLFPAPDAEHRVRPAPHPGLRTSRSAFVPMVETTTVRIAATGQTWEQVGNNNAPNPDGASIQIGSNQ